MPSPPGLVGLLLVVALPGWSAALSTSVALQPSTLDASANSTTVSTLPDITVAEKQAAEEASEAADTAVSKLERARDEAWRDSRSNLAIASSPPIRSESVLAMLSAETERFAQLEANIKAGKAEAAHKRSLAELVGGAWDARESRKLKVLRRATADARLADAKVAEQEAFAAEADVHRRLLEERRVGGE